MAKRKSKVSLASHAISEVIEQLAHITTRKQPFRLRRVMHKCYIEAFSTTEKKWMAVVELQPVGINDLHALAAFYNYVKDWDAEIERRVEQHVREVHNQLVAKGAVEEGDNEKADAVQIAAAVE